MFGSIYRSALLKRANPVSLPSRFVVEPIIEPYTFNGFRHRYGLVPLPSSQQIAQRVRDDPDINRSLDRLMAAARAGRPGAIAQAALAGSLLTGSGYLTYRLLKRLTDGKTKQPDSSTEKRGSLPSSDESVSQTMRDRYLALSPQDREIVNRYDAQLEQAGETTSKLLARRSNVLLPGDIEVPLAWMATAIGTPFLLHRLLRKKNQDNPVTAAKTTKTGSALVKQSELGLDGLLPGMPNPPPGMPNPPPVALNPFENNYRRRVEMARRRIEDMTDELLEESGRRFTPGSLASLAVPTVTVGALGGAGVYLMRRLIDKVRQQKSTAGPGK